MGTGCRRRSAPHRKARGRHSSGVPVRAVATPRPPATAIANAAEAAAKPPLGPPLAARPALSFRRPSQARRASPTGRLPEPSQATLRGAGAQGPRGGPQRGAKRALEPSWRPKRGAKKTPAPKWVSWRLPLAPRLCFVWPRVALGRGAWPRMRVGVATVWRRERRCWPPSRATKGRRARGVRGSLSPPSRKRRRPRPSARWGGHRASSFCYTAYAEDMPAEALRGR